MTMVSRSQRGLHWQWAPDKVQPCGTDAGYERHIYHGEIACLPCMDAHAAAAKKRRRARKAVMIREAAG